MTARGFIEGFAAKRQLDLGIPVVIEPSEVDLARPAFKLVVSGIETQGEDREKIVLNGSLEAKGDGPTVFLDSVLTPSRLLAKMTEKALSDQIEAGVGITSTIKRTQDGRFTENEEGELKYSFFESYRVEISYNPKHLT